MKKIRKFALLASCVTALGLGITGCEWEATDSDESWSDSYNWVNFSGVYKNPGGGSVVTDFTSSIAPATNGTAVAVPIGVTVIARGNGGTTYSGALLANVVPGTLQITAGGVTFTDNGAGVLIPDTGLTTQSGTISYGSGAWSINLAGSTVPSGQNITARYSVFQTGSVLIPGSNTSRNRGTTGTSILSFTVLQEGNKLTLIDSDGMRYTGKFGSLRSASGDLGASPRLGDVVIGQYKVTGTSRVGFPVEIIGTLQGTVVVSGRENFVMAARSLQGQWIEKVAGGKVGDVVGAAMDAAINFGTTGDLNGSL